MLRSCLESLITQDIPAGWRAEIVVIDNEAESKASVIVNDIAGDSPFPISHVYEPNRGIPFARNRALEISLSRNAQWIAFIDDDEIAEKGWLGALMKAATGTNADVLHGLTKYNYPPMCRKWRLDKKRALRKTGDPLVCASTNNVMFRAALAHSDHMGLRFDIDRAFSGGSDTAFFYNATDNGARIIHVAEAVVTENVPEERCSFKWRMKRYYRCSANSSSIEIKRKGRLVSALRLAPKLLACLVESAAICLLLPLLLFHAPSFRRYLFKAGRRLAYALGIVAAYLGRLPRPYATIEGH